MVDKPSRQEGLQRIQIGLTGLAGVVLLVGLANIVIEKARMDDRSLPPAVVPTLTGDAVNAAGPLKEPLAELGVTPSADQSSSQVVPDLLPDPNIRKPMDRDPQQH
ncbi:hypothetical protein BH10PSE12_BH10PSE12_06490 [soil metagenome]